jgi:hypothetical protein
MCRLLDLSISRQDTPKYFQFIIIEIWTLFLDFSMQSAHLLSGKDFIFPFSDFHHSQHVVDLLCFLIQRELAQVLTGMFTTWGSAFTEDEIATFQSILDQLCPDEFGLFEFEAVENLRRQCAPNEFHQSCFQNFSSQLRQAPGLEDVSVGNVTKSFRV